MQSSKHKAMMAQIKKRVEAEKKLNGKILIRYTIHNQVNHHSDGSTTRAEPLTSIIHNADLTDVAKLQHQFKHLGQKFHLEVENENEKHKSRVVFDK